MSSPVNSIKMQGKSNWNKRRDQPAKARQFQNRKETQVTCLKCTLRGHVAEDCTVKCLYKYCKTLGHIRKNCYKLRNKSHNVEDVSELQEQNDEEEDPNTYLFYVDVQPPTLNIVPAPTQCASNSHEQSSSVVSAQHASNSYKKSSSIKEADRHNVSVVCVENVSNVNMNDECFLNSKYHVSEINSISNVDSKPLIQVSLNDKTVNFELDSGSAITCISSSKFRQLELENCRIVECSKTLCVANVQIVHVRNKAIVSIQYKGVSYGDRGLLIVDANFPTLLGRDWIKVIFGPDWLSRFVNHVSFPDENERRQTFIEKIKENPIFRSEIGDVHGYEARLNLKPDARPRFCKARVAAFAIKDKVVDELNKILSELESSIAKLKNGKAVAEDGIMNEFLKNTSRLMRQTIVKVFNDCLNQGVYPWNVALITPIHKKGDKYDPDNYRAIAVGSNLGKLFAGVLFNRLLMYRNVSEESSLVASNTCIPTQKPKLN